MCIRALQGKKRNALLLLMWETDILLKKRVQPGLAAEKKQNTERHGSKDAENIGYHFGRNQEGF